MHRVRTAGCLLLVPPLAVVLDMLQVADRATLRGNPGADDFLRTEFGFWRSGVAADVRLELAVHLVLTAVAVVAGVAAIVTGRHRFVVFIVAVAQAIVTLPGVIWDHVTFHVAPPDWIVKAPLPVPGGRWTSIMFLAAALAAAALTRPTGRTRLARR